MEGLAGEGTALARLTFDFLRPVPIAPLALRAEVTRAGAKVLRLQAALVAPDGTPCVQASAVALRTTPALPEALGDLEPAPSPPEASAPFEFPFFVDPVGYHSAVEVRIARGTWGKGPVAAWDAPARPARGRRGSVAVAAPARRRRLGERPRRGARSYPLHLRQRRPHGRRPSTPRRRVAVSRCRHGGRGSRDRPHPGAPLGRPRPPRRFAPDVSGGAPPRVIGRSAFCAQRFGHNASNRVLNGDLCHRHQIAPAFGGDVFRA